MLDILLIVLGIILLIVGILGCVLPVIPGPPISYIGLIMLHITHRYQIDGNKLLWLAFVAIFVTVLDYVIPVWGTKRFGGSKAGVWGATIGLVIGLFIGSVGIILGPFAGAIIGETMQGKESKDALRAGFGAFIGFLTGIGIKLMASGFMTFYFFKELIRGI